MGRAAQSVGWTLLVVMAVGLPGVFIAKVRIFEPDPWQGLMYLALLLGTVKAGDIGAYAIGSTLGRHQLVPRLSPKKTVEGLVGALAAGTGAALLIGCLWGGFAWWQMLVFGLAVSLAGVLGDLAESLLKRACERQGQRPHARFRRRAGHPGLDPGRRPRGLPAACGIDSVGPIAIMEPSANP